MKFAICAVLFCINGVAFALDQKNRYLSPDGEAESIILSVPFKATSPNWTESAIYFRDYSAEKFIFRNFASGDGEHGLFFVSGKWTPDSNYFIFTANSSGGHSPWRLRTYVYRRIQNDLLPLDEDYIEPVVSPDFSALPPHSLKIKVMDDSLEEPTEGKWISVDLGTVFPKSAEQGAAANP